MALSLPNLTPVRRAVLVAALGAPLLASLPVASAAAAKAKPAPIVQSVKPMTLSVGDVLEVRGRHFLRGRGRNTVVFQRQGAKAVFVKAEIGTAKLLRVRIPDRLESFLLGPSGGKQPTRFRIRILSARFGKRFTQNAGSPTIRAKAAAPPADGPPPIQVVLPTGEPVLVAPPVDAPADGDCDSDGVKNGVDTDDDGDLLDDAVELSLGLEPCKADTDGDSVGDGYEYRSARDLNDDEHQEPNRFLPYPGKRPYPNPLDGTDANTDFDGDVLTLSEEHRLWVRYGDRTAGGLDRLNYSDGMQCSISVRGSDGRRRSSLAAATYDKHAAFLQWAQTQPNLDSGAGGYITVYHPGGAYDPHPAGLYDIRDVNHDGSVRAADDPNYLTSELLYFDFDGDGFLCDNERDEDADGLTNYDEAHGRVNDGYWKDQYPGEKPYLIAYGGTDLADEDSDGDGVRDGADDLDHDDIPNLAELSRVMATGDETGQPQGDSPQYPPRGFTNRLTPPDPADGTQPQGRVNPTNPCLPNRSSRTCLRHPPFGADAPAPFDLSANYHVFN